MPGPGFKHLDIRSDHPASTELDTRADPKLPRIHDEQSARVPRDGEDEVTPRCEIAHGPLDPDGARAASRPALCDGEDGTAGRKRRLVQRRDHDMAPREAPAPDRADASETDGSHRSGASRHLRAPRLAVRHAEERGAPLPV